jgi:hypothetical protein
MNHNLPAAVALASCVALSGCLRYAIDSDPRPVRFETDPARPDRLSSLLDAAYSQASKSRDQSEIDVLLAEFKRSGDALIGDFLRKNGFRCDQTTCAYQYLTLFNYAVGGDYNPTYSASSIIISFRDEQRPTANSVRIARIATPFKERRDG